MNEYPQVLTHKLKETEFFARQSEQEKQRISDWLLVNGFINVIEGDFQEEDTTPVEVTVFQRSA